MKATSTQNIKNVKDICFSIENNPLERESKLTIVASTNDDIFAFEFEGSDLLQSCKRSGLFTGWEKDQKIRELEKDLQEIQEAFPNLPETPITDTMLVDDHLRLTKENERIKENLNSQHEMIKELNQKNLKLQEENEEYEDKIEDLQHKYNLEREANEAQRKFFKKYAGEGVEIEFHCAVGDDEYTYVIVDKEEYKALKKIQNNVKDNGCYSAMIHGKVYNTAQLVDRILELEKLKTPTIENFADEEPSDNVNHPSHYTGRYECIDVMQDVFGNEATDNFCLCNAFKYIWRANKKNGLEDVKKAVWYLNKYIEEAEKDGVSKGEQI